MSYKPDGYNDVSVYLIVSDAEATLDFLKKAFEAPELRVVRDDDEIIVHAEARIGDTVVMMGQSDDAIDVHVHVYVPDVDAAIEQAVIAGAGLVQPATEKGDGDRRGGVKAPDGTTWWLSTQLNGTRAA